MSSELPGFGAAFEKRSFSPGPQFISRCLYIHTHAIWFSFGMILKVFCELGRIEYLLSLASGCYVRIVKGCFTVRPCVSFDARMSMCDVVEWWTRRDSKSSKRLHTLIFLYKQFQSREQFSTTEDAVMDSEAEQEFIMTSLIPWPKSLPECYSICAMTSILFQDRPFQQQP